MISKIIKTILLVLLLVALLGSLYFLVNRNNKPPVQIPTIYSRVGDIINKAVASGSISPRREVAIKPRVSGVLDSLHVEAGELVERGQLLARIQVVPDAVTLNSAQARVETARISERNAGSELNRRKRLFAQKLISRGEYDQYRYEYDIKAEELSGAVSNLALIQEGSTGDGGTVSNEIRSTVSGTVLDLPVKEGESITETNNFNEGSTIALVADMTDMVFIGTVDESEVGRIREGMGLRVSIGAIEDVIFDGLLEFIAPKGEKEEGAVHFEIRASITNDGDHTVRAGYSANADVVLDQRESVVLLDERALLFDDGKTYVETKVGEQEFDRIEVATGLSDGINIEILDGLQGGREVRLQ